jgi:hypothetical protein
MLWIFVAGMIAVHAFFLWRVRAGIERGDPDFTVFYTAGRMLRLGLGAHLYDPRAQQTVQAEFAKNFDVRRGPLPYIHPPFEALVFLPLTYFPYSRAFVLWDLLNLGILFGVGYFLRRWLPGLQRASVMEWVLLSLAFFPVFANFHQGQDAILLLLVLTLSFQALGRDADFLAGSWLGIGVFKYHLILPLALILAVWRGKKLLTGFGLVAVAEVLTSCLLVGWRGVLPYPAYAWRVVSVPALGGIPMRQQPNLVGVLGGWVSFRGPGWLLPVVVGGFSVVLTIAVVKLRPVVVEKQSLKLGLACAVITALLVGYSTNTYDLSLLIVPLAVTLDYNFGDGVSHASRRLSLLVPAIPLLVSPVWFFLWMRFERINLMGLVLLWWVYVIRAELFRLKQSGSILRADAQREVHA